MAKGKFLSNISNPKSADARKYFTHNKEAFLDSELADLEWQYYLDWVEKNEIGRPSPTEHYTVEELENMGMVGIYSKC